MPPHPIKLYTENDSQISTGFREVQRLNEELDRSLKQEKTENNVIKKPLSRQYNLDKLHLTPKLGSTEEMNQTQALSSSYPHQESYGTEERNITDKSDHSGKKELKSALHMMKVTVETKQETSAEGIAEKR